MQSKAHWERVHGARPPQALSWYQPHDRLSLELIRATSVTKSAPIIDVGGGSSTLVDDLLAAGYTDLTVLDLSDAALATARARLGAAAECVRWVEADVIDAELPVHHYAVWHDRAAFHFLVDAADRAAYVEALEHALAPAGHLIVATFADDGPERCSGLPVVRYSPEALCAEFGSGFALLQHERETHRTPAGAEQRFLYCRFRRNPS